VTEFEQGFAGTSKQRLEECSGCSATQRAQLARQREDDMKVPLGQEPFRACSYPSLLRQALALWTVPIATGVVRGLLMSARATHFEMAAEHGGAAPLDGGQHTSLGSTQPILGFELGSVLTDDIGDVEAGPSGGCRAVTHRAQPVLRIRSSGLFVLARTAVLTRAYRVVVRMLS
jgi:hypothetical protein